LLEINKGNRILDLGAAEAVQIPPFPRLKCALPEIKKRNRVKIIVDGTTNIMIFKRFGVFTAVKTQIGALDLLFSQR
jgi:hypothetical protein